MISTKDLPPPDDRQPVRRALLSVSDKSGLVPFGKRLHAMGVELLSTGGTARALRDEGIPVMDVADVTGFPEILGGRVKSLHPKIHGGILARRTDPDDIGELAEYDIGAIDLVVVNLYPFREAIAKPDVDDALAAENVDIGGPGMLRAAAKNFAFVAAVVNPEDYDAIADELETNDGTLGMVTRRRLAGDAFAHTAEYDTAIAGYFAGHVASSAPVPKGSIQPSSAPTDASALPEALSIDLPRASTLRYGENPHQLAALYSLPRTRSGDAPDARYAKLHGKDLSFNNLIDLSAALNLIAEFADAPPTVAILKHTNPCGVGQADALAEAYAKAFATDRQSPFGGIVVVNRALDLTTAEAINAVFTEIIIAPEYEDGVLAFLQEKANRRLIRADVQPMVTGLDMRTVAGGLLAQTPDGPLASASEMRQRWTIATDRLPSEREWADLDFAWRVCKHVKSNAIVYARDGATLGIGAGQMSRIDSSEIAVAKGAKSELDFSGCVVASDAFFPFADGLEAAAASGAVAVVQPGGSVRDDEVIAAANARDMAMVFTGQRHFRH
ncbi:MAG: bifunctional phosphoribosylaminoimidazolecarboxamide formyltransferase/IMP cyclohydrolase [Rubricoccaceae bacterium]